jgi:drug/metabolite transporter (DMT)-like permease
VIQRTLETDAVTQVAGRALFAAAALFVFAVLQERRRVFASFRSLGRPELALAVLMAISSSTFLLALNHASVASVLFMQAVGPFLAAGLGWALLRERVEGRTWVAMAVALAGVGVMIGGPGSGSALGHTLAFGMTLAFAATIVITRHRRERSMIPAVCVSQLLVVCAFGPFAHPGGLDGRDLLLTGVMGGGQIGLGLALLTVGARVIPPAEVAMISLLEVVLGPLWVWLAYEEGLATATLVGGAIVLVAVAAQSIGELRSAPGGRAGAVATLSRE